MIIFSSNFSLIKKVILTISYCIQSLCYLYTILRNPGIPNLKRFYLNPLAKEGLIRFKTCRKCKCIMDLRKNTYHCNFCGVCVEGNLFLFVFLFHY